MGHDEVEEEKPAASQHKNMRRAMWMRGNGLAKHKKHCLHGQKADWLICCGVLSGAFSLIYCLMLGIDDGFCTKHDGDYGSIQMGLRGGLVSISIYIWVN